MGFEVICTFVFCIVFCTLCIYVFIITSLLLLKKSRKTKNANNIFSICHLTQITTVAGPCHVFEM